MAILVFLIISILILVVVKNTDIVSKRIFIPYVLIWGIGLLLSTMGIDGMYKPQSSTIYILLGHLITFTIGFVSVKVHPSIVTYNVMDSLDNSINYVINVKWFKILFYCTLLYCFYLFSKFYDLILLYGALGEFRQDYFEGGIYGMAYEIVYPLILLPFEMVLMVLFGYRLVKKNDFYTWIIGLYLLVFSSLKAGRGAFVNIIIAVIYSIYCMSKYCDVDKRAKKKAMIFISVLFFLIYSIMSLMSIGRDGNTDISWDSVSDGIEMTNSHVVSYVSGPVVAFDEAINSHWENKIGGYKNGRLVFSMADDVLYYLSMIAHPFIGVPVYERPIVKVSQYTQESFDIGNMRWNALFTSCFYYYLDFGIAGVLIIPFFLGILVRWVIKQFYKNQNIYLYSLLCMIFLVMVNSIQRLFLYEAWSLILIVLMLKLGIKNSATKYYKR